MQVRVVGEPSVKGMLEAAVTDDGSSNAVVTGYRWLISETIDGSYVELPGILTKTIVLLASYSGGYLKVQVYSGTAGAVESEPVGPVRAVNGNPRTDWLCAAQYGISHHFIANYLNRVAASPEEQWKQHEDWNDVINSFDVNAYAEQVAGSGAGFVLLTLGQNCGRFLAPNAVYEEIAGVRPGERCATRDLPMEIAHALDTYGIKLMLYVPANPPHSAHMVDGDYAITRAFGFSEGTDSAPTQETMRLWQSVIKEWSDRYGELLAGWWFDGVFPAMAGSYDNMQLPYNWSSIANVAKSGNAHRIMCLNSGIGGIAINSPYEDFTAGETNEIGGLPGNGRWVDEANGIQYFTFTFLGENDPKWAGWGNKGLSRPTSELADWVKGVTDRKGVVCLDAKVNRFGKIDPDQLEQLREIKLRVR
ncbi:hypothetical protein [Paenibacillus sp. BC26]|uniref:hypothetical protein n=1 Tax=Paenibacillus sp. BC26 TaxID=1881032 RepID=UPI0008E765F4|nr:hypothetical protein [Paenibacillus sp. BC26]SFT10356.1 hypothetical protein SAMN05428962_4429 [Paenibacillus sp. BC26]